MIPVLDWTEFQSDPKGFADDLGKACRETGFFLVTGHNVDPDLIGRVFDAADRFFALPEAQKAALDMRKNPHNRGWVAFGAERLDEKSGLADQKEAFNIGLDLAADDPRVLAKEPFRGVNIWPDLPGFSEVLMAYYDAVLGLGVDLHKAIAVDLGLDERFFAPHFEVPMAFLRLLLTRPTSMGSAQEPTPAMGRSRCCSPTASRACRSNCGAATGWMRRMSRVPLSSILAMH